MAAKILTISTKCGKIFTAREIAPEGHQNGGGCFPRSEGSELSFSPFKTMRGGDTMYVTWEELLLLLSAIIALLNYIRNIHNKKK